MNPVASVASAILTTHLLKNPQVLAEMGDDYAEAFATACCIAMEQAGYDLENDRERIKQFFEDNADQIQTVSVSIVLQKYRAQQKPLPGWVGKAVAFGAGALIAAILGG
jgi:hypothetical protein